jgi:hypothetical protein
VWRAALSRGVPASLVLAAALLTAFVAPPPAAAASSWVGGTYPVSDGQHVSVHVSTTYPDASAAAQRWATFFGGLPHGRELSLVEAYVAPLDEVRELCHNVDVLGCYMGDELVTVGDAVAGTLPTSVAAHDYGHHIAANRNNAPWLALDWGTKRWASAMGICSRVANDVAFPGDEGVNYTLNPGEAFAESYRVLVETGGTATGYTWPVVDPSFRPDTPALDALLEDVLDPWAGQVTTTIRARFAGGSRSWTSTIQTPLDGSLRIQISNADDLTLMSPDGHGVLATSSWTSSGGKALDYRICGTRSLKVRVVRRGAASRFTLRITHP